MEKADCEGGQEYDDMMDLPHHVSAVKPHMSLAGRAAQFSPFAALTGYEDALKEIERLAGESEKE